MTARLFIAFLVLIAGAVVGLSFLYLSRRTAARVALGLLIWLGYVGALGYAGVLQNLSLRPPGIAYVLIPVFLFMGLAIIRSPAALKVALAMPLPLLLGAQSFRIGVELLLNQLWLDGVVPKMLTFEGANVDIFIGASAPLVAWIATRGRTGMRLALGWSALGLIALANVAIRSAMTAPGPFNLLHTEVPNLAISTFPFFYIAAFFAPLAVALHILAIRAMRAAPRTAKPEPKAESDAAGASRTSQFGGVTFNGETR